MAKIKLTEEEVAQVTSLLFESWGYDLYPEAKMECFGGRPDLVGVKTNYWCAVVECKSSLSYPVLEQVCRWHMERDFLTRSEWYCPDKRPDRTAIPHFLWVATGNSRDSKMHDMKAYLLDKFRIGWIDIVVENELPEGWDLSDWYCSGRYPNKAIIDQGLGHGTVRINNHVYSFRIMCEAPIQEGSRKTAHHIIKQLYPEMKQATAGTTGSKTNYMTPFKLTLQNTLKSMEDGKAYTAKQLLGMINSAEGHHYATDKSYLNSIGKWLMHFDHVDVVIGHPNKYKKRL